MTKDDNLRLGRRAFVRRSLAIVGAVTVVPAVLAGCGGDELSCTDTSGLSAAEKQTRTANRYVDKSTDPNKNCANCALFVSEGTDQCGTCQVVKGPIHPQGNCALWVPKV